MSGSEPLCPDHSAGVNRLTVRRAASWFTDCISWVNTRHRQITTNGERTMTSAQQNRQNRLTHQPVYRSRRANPPIFQGFMFALISTLVDRAFGQSVFE